MANRTRLRARWAWGNTWAWGNWSGGGWAGVMRELTAELRSAVLAFVLAGSASTGLIAWAGLNVAWWLFLLLLNTAAGLFSVFLGWEWRRAAPLAGASLALALGLLGAAAGQVFVLPVQLLSDPFGVRDTSVISVLLVDRLGLGEIGRAHV